MLSASLQAFVISYLFRSKSAEVLKSKKSGGKYFTTRDVETIFKFGEGGGGAGAGRSSAMPKQGPVATYSKILLRLHLVHLILKMA